MQYFKVSDKNQSALKADNNILRNGLQGVIPIANVKLVLESTYKLKADTRTPYLTIVKIKDKCVINTYNRINFMIYSISDVDYNNKEMIKESIFKSVRYLFKLTIENELMLSLLAEYIFEKYRSIDLNNLNDPVPYVVLVNMDIKNPNKVNRKMVKPRLDPFHTDWSKYADRPKKWEGTVMNTPGDNNEQ